MASEDTLLGSDFVVQVGNGATPEVFTDLCAAFDFGNVGEEKPLVDTTAYCDDSRTYRNGLADGVEISLQANYIVNDAGLESLYADYVANTVRNFRIYEKDASPSRYFQFAATIRAWSVTGPIGEKAVMQFTMKISGAVTWVRP